MYGSLARILHADCSAHQHAMAARMVCPRCLSIRGLLPLMLTLAHAGGERCTQGILGIYQQLNIGPAHTSAPTQICSNSSAAFVLAGEASSASDVVTHFNTGGIVSENVATVARARLVAFPAVHTSANSGESYFPHAIDIAIDAARANHTGDLFVLNTMVGSLAANANFSLLVRIRAATGEVERIRLSDASLQQLWRPVSMCFSRSSPTLFLLNRGQPLAVPPIIAVDMHDTGTVSTRAIVQPGALAAKYFLNPLAITAGDDGSLFICQGSNGLSKSTVLKVDRLGRTSTFISSGAAFLPPSMAHCGIAFDHASGAIVVAPNSDGILHVSPFGATSRIVTAPTGNTFQDVTWSPAGLFVVMSSGDVGWVKLQCTPDRWSALSFSAVVASVCAVFAALLACSQRKLWRSRIAKRKRGEAGQLIDGDSKDSAVTDVGNVVHASAGSSQNIYPQGLSRLVRCSLMALGIWPLFGTQNTSALFRSQLYMWCIMTLQLLYGISHVYYSFQLIELWTEESEAAQLDSGTITLAVTSGIYRISNVVCYFLLVKKFAPNFLNSTHERGMGHLLVHFYESILRVSQNTDLEEHQRSGLALSQASMRRKRLRRHSMKQKDTTADVAGLHGLGGSQKDMLPRQRTMYNRRARLRNHIPAQTQSHDTSRADEDAPHLGFTLKYGAACLMLVLFGVLLLGSITRTLPNTLPLLVLVRLGITVVAALLLLCRSLLVLFKSEKPRQSRPGDSQLSVQDSVQQCNPGFDAGDGGANPGGAEDDDSFPLPYEYKLQKIAAEHEIRRCSRRIALLSLCIAVVYTSIWLLIDLYVLDREAVEAQDYWRINLVLHKFEDIFLGTSMPCAAVLFVIAVEAHAIRCRLHITSRLEVTAQPALRFAKTAVNMSRLFHKVISDGCIPAPNTFLDHFRRPTARKLKRWISMGPLLHSDTDLLEESLLCVLDGYRNTKARTRDAGMHAKATISKLKDHLKELLDHMKTWCTQKDTLDQQWGSQVVQVQETPEQMPSDIEHNLEELTKALLQELLPLLADDDDMSSTRKQKKCSLQNAVHAVRCANEQMRELCSSVAHVSSGFQSLITCVMVSGLLYQFASAYFVLLRLYGNAAGTDAASLLLGTLFNMLYCSIWMIIILLAPARFASQVVHCNRSIHDLLSTVHDKRLRVIGRQAEKQGPGNASDEHPDPDGRAEDSLINALQHMATTDLAFKVLGAAVDFNSLARLLAQTLLISLPFIVYDLAAIRQDQD